MNRRAAVTAAGVAVAVSAAVAGCSTTVSGAARPSSELKAASVDATAPITPDTPQREWVDVSGKAVPMPREELGGTQYSLTPLPGASVRYRAFDGGTGICTLGPAVRVGAREGFVTAGHCALDALGPQQLTGPDGLPAHDFGIADDAAFSYGYPNDSGYAQDSALVWAEPGAGAAVMAGKWPVAGVLSVAEVRALPVGTPICFAGSVTGGAACGPLLDARDPGGIHLGRAAKTGDSGAAAFVVDTGGSAWLVGIMSSTDNDRPESTAALLAPALDRLDAEVITSS